MTLKILFYAIALTVMFAGCTSVENNQNDVGYTVIENPEYSELQDTEEPPVSFELMDEFVFNEDEEILIGAIWYLTTDNNGNIYFYDYGQSRLVSLNPEGGVRWVTGEEGRGPGDFEGVRNMFLHNNERLYISNVSGSRLDIYDLEGNFLSSHSLPEQLSGSILGITSENKLVAVTTYWNNIGVNIRVAENSDSLEILNEFPINQFEGAEVEMSGSMAMGVILHEDQLISGNFGEYAFNFYNLDGNVEKKVIRDFDRISRPAVTPNAVRSFGGVNPPVFFPEGHYAARISWADNIADTDQYVRSGSEKEIIFKGTLDFYTPADKLIYSFEYDDFSFELGSLAHVDSEGYAYFTTTNPVPTIRKYNVGFP